MRSASVRPLVTILVLVVTAMLALSCTQRSAGEPAAAVEATAFAIETRVLEVTREVTVVVTATPVPTPPYTSLINALPGVLAYPLPGDPLTLDPQQASDTASLLVAQQLYEGLFDLRGNGEITPAAATGYSASADSTVYTVTLRAGLTWSSGQAVTAQDYVAGVCRLLDPVVGSPFAYLLTEVAPLQGAAAYASGDMADCAKVGISAPDDLTLRFTLAQPAAFFPALLTTHLFWPRPPGVAPATNGPYLLAKQVAGEYVILTSNPVYWNAAGVAIERIEFRIAPDLAQQLALYEAGDLQVAEFPASETPRIQADPLFGRELHVLMQPGISYLGFNIQAAPTDDANVRRAIASAIDRQALIEQVLQQPWHAAARALIPPGIPGYRDEDLSGYPYDPAAAGQFLVEAGYGPDKPLPPVELWYNREGNNEVLFKAIGDMLEQAGIPVRSVSSGWPFYRDALNACAGASSSAKCGYNLYRMGWVMDYADASSLLRIFGSRSALQYTGWVSEDYDRLLAEASAEPDETVRTGLHREAERLLLADAVIVPLQYYDRVVLVKAGITFDYPLFGPPDFQHWKLR